MTISDSGRCSLPAGKLGAKTTPAAARESSPPAAGLILSVTRSVSGPPPELVGPGTDRGDLDRGLGLTHPEYTRVMQFLGAYDCNVTALLSAHQAIGVPQPVKLFGSDALKKEYLPRCAKGAISAFA